MKILLLPIVLLSGVLIYHFGLTAARNVRAESPRLIAFIAALVVALSMLQVGDAVLTFVLIPCAALGITLFLLWTLRWLLVHGVIERLRRLLADVLALSHRKSPPPPGDSNDAGKEAGRIRPATDDKD